MWFQGCDFAPSGANYTTYCLPWRAAIHHTSTLSPLHFGKRFTDTARCFIESVRGAELL